MFLFRVKNLEKTNFRYLSFDRIGTFVDLVVIDVSFIGLSKILPQCRQFLCRGGQVIALIKPQFEAGKENLSKGGIVTSNRLHSKIITQIEDLARQLGFETKGIETSPIAGKKSGNQEFLLSCVKS